jgi:hypothetical protein
MSTPIDWSKAPAHATHWCPGNARIAEGWIYQAGGEFYSCYADSGLEHIPAFPDWRKARLVPRQAPWTGEGLPPVGTVCELSERVLLADSDTSDWFEAGTKVEVGGHARFDGATGPVCAICVVDENFTGTLTEGCLRPIRTPEQIAAEERDKASVELAVILAGHDQHIAVRDIEMAKYLYDAGYRKKVAP